MYLFTHRKLRGATVVVTGASSGIGRASALLFAKKGANLVLAARRDEPLQDLADECERRFGVRALAMPMDVRHEDEVDDLARRAIDEFGKVDVWVNNAGVLLTARLEEAPMDVCREVIETNLFGTIYGCRAILPHFRARGRGGIVNISSVDGKVGGPWQGCYSASKFGVTGLSQALRGELLDTPGVTVTTIFPSAMDTPLFEHGANYTGRQTRTLYPTYSVWKTARAIVRAAEHPRREIIVGMMGKIGAMANTVCPYVGERMMAATVRRTHLEKRPAPATAGAVREPMAQGTGVSGGWLERGYGTPLPAGMGGATQKFGERLGVPGRTLMGVAAFGLGWLAYKALTSRPARMAASQIKESAQGQWREGWYETRRPTRPRNWPESWLGGRGAEGRSEGWTDVGGWMGSETGSAARGGVSASARA